MKKIASFLLALTLTFSASAQSTQRIGEVQTSALGRSLLTNESAAQWAAIILLGTNFNFSNLGQLNGTNAWTGQNSFTNNGNVYVGDGAGMSNIQASSIFNNSSLVPAGSSYDNGSTWGYPQYTVAVNATNAYVIYVPGSGSGNDQGAMWGGSLQFASSQSGTIFIPGTNHIQLRASNPNSAVLARLFPATNFFAGNFIGNFGGTFAGTGGGNGAGWTNLTATNLSGVAQISNGGTGTNTASGISQLYAIYPLASDIASNPAATPLMNPQMGMGPNAYIYVNANGSSNTWYKTATWGMPIAMGQFNSMPFVNVTNTDQRVYWVFQGNTQYSAAGNTNFLYSLGGPVIFNGNPYGPGSGEWLEDVNPDGSQGDKFAGFIGVPSPAAWEGFSPGHFMNIVPDTGYGLLIASPVNNLSFNGTNYPGNWYGQTNAAPLFEYLMYFNWSNGTVNIPYQVTGVTRPNVARNQYMITFDTKTGNLYKTNSHGTNYFTASYFDTNIPADNVLGGSLISGFEIHGGEYHSMGNGTTQVYHDVFDLDYLSSFLARLGFGESPAGPSLDHTSNSPFAVYTYGSNTLIGPINNALYSSAGGGEDFETDQSGARFKVSISTVSNLSASSISVTNSAAANIILGDGTGGTSGGFTNNHFFSTNGFSSTSSSFNNTVPVGSTGLTNTSPLIMVFNISTINSTLTNFDAAGVAWSTNTALTNTQEWIVQPGGFIKASGGITSNGSHAF